MSDIEWTDETWNPTVGCSRVSAGCDACYAIGVAHRKMQPAHEGLTKLRPKTANRPGVDWNGAVRCLPERLEQPFRWKKPRRVFVNSMSDLFHESVPDLFIAKVFAVMASLQRHTFQVLTKRPARALEWFDWQAGLKANERGAVLWPERARERDRLNGICPHPLDAYKGYPPWPLPNVWLGISAEDQATWDERVPRLLMCDAAVRFVSAEPLLGPIDAEWGIDPRERDIDCRFDSGPWGAVPHGRRIDWIIVGGESGARARPMDIGWVRRLGAQCVDAGVPVFVKQLGRHPYENVSPDRDFFFDLGDRKGKDMAEWPPDLRVRQFPEVQR